MGRPIIPEDNMESAGQSGGWPVVISDNYWHRRFAADPNVLGQHITINTIPFAIVGVLPPNFSGLSLDQPADVLMPAITQLQVTICLRWLSQTRTVPRSDLCVAQAWSVHP
jgi:hypothetical protein